MSNKTKEVEAGLELDAMVAEKVMGWKWVSWIGIPIKGTQGYPKYRRVKQLFAPETLARILPNYSTDISAAWEVVEKIGLPWSAWSYPEGICFQFRGDFPYPQSSAATLAQAICRAALEAVKDNA